MFNPYGTSGESQTVSWQPEPNSRGTWNILSSCLITIGLCVWTALHLNIPEYGKASRQHLRKSGWLIIGLFAPELVVLTAFEQNKSARGIHRSMRAVLGQSPPESLKHKILRFFRRWTPPFGSQRGSDTSRETEHKNLGHSEGGSPKIQSSSQDRHSWTLTHSFYAAMGGFALDSSDSKLTFLPEHERQPLVITAKALETLATKDNNLLPNHSEAQIYDKSKASGLAKLIVCAQALWFCIQCLSRLSQGDPVSLLELNTAAHSLCALLVYLLWWDKPLDVGEPTLIQGERAHEISAQLSLSGPEKRIRIPVTHYKRGSSADCQIEVHIELSYDNKGPARQEALEEPDQPALLLGFTRLYVGQSLYNYHIVRWSGKLPSRSWWAAIPPSDFCFLHIDLSPEQVMLLELAHKARSHGFFVSPYMFRSRIRNWPSFEIGKRSFAISFSLAGLIYGAIHLTAWNAPFPTALQCTLWRISCITLVVSGPAYVVMFYTNRLYEWDEEKHSRFECCICCFAVYGLWPYVLLYIISRVYLVVECFLELRRLPSSVYKVQSWSQHLPHFA